MIRVLEPYIADKIAAGEVTERPLSVVKELVENSIDAGASEIIVEIRHGGKTYLRVTDNGSGIPSDEVETAFLRHATGKISTLADLGRIESLGFRGEALASIAAVSRVTVYTRTQEENLGVKLLLHGGTKVGGETAGVNKGTTMVVEDLFYNTPARRKFLKSDAAEASAIIELLQHLAVYYANIAFRLINNGQTVLSTTGNCDVLMTIQTLYPTFRDLIKVEGPIEDATHTSTVRGYLSGPGETLSTRRGQLFFVNGRIVSSKVIERGLKKGYGDRVFSGHPIAILFLDVPPESIDVNIHPTKREIKFLDEKSIENAVADAVRNILPLAEAIPNAVPTRVRDASETEKTYHPSDTAASAASHSEPRESWTGEQVSILFEEEPLPEEKTSEDEELPIREFLSRIERKHEGVDKVSQDINRDSEENDIIKESGDPSDRKFIILQEPENRPFDFSRLVIRGYIFSTYIITESEGMLYIIDQHAAHERILYEKMIRRYNAHQHISQPLLVPFEIEVASDIYHSDRPFFEDLKDFGYDIEDFGVNTFRVRGIPEDMNPGEAERFLRNFLNETDSEESVRGPVLAKWIMRSCKAAVKGNDILSEEEQRALLRELSSCRNPFSCPHGRPVFIRISRGEVERAFKR